MVIFLRKISQGMVSGYSVQFASDGASPLCVYNSMQDHITPKLIMKTVPIIVKKATYNPFGVMGARIVNLHQGHDRWIC